jgi:hypothetical protein
MRQLLKREHEEDPGGSRHEWRESAEDSSEAEMRQLLKREDKEVL